MGLAKQHRLCETRRFSELFESPHRLTTADFTLRFDKNSTGVMRMGLVLSKKKFRGPSIAIA